MASECHRRDAGGDGAVQSNWYWIVSVPMCCLGYSTVLHCSSFPLGGQWMKDTWDLSVLFLTIACESTVIS